VRTTILPAAQRPVWTQVEVQAPAAPVPEAVAVTAVPASALAVEAEEVQVSVPALVEAEEAVRALEVVAVVQASALVPEAAEWAPIAAPPEARASFRGPRAAAEQASAPVSAQVAVTAVQTPT
jgi:hypothetical protein